MRARLADIQRDVEATIANVVPVAAYQQDGTEVWTPSAIPLTVGLPSGGATHLLYSVSVERANANDALDIGPDDQGVYVELTLVWLYAVRGVFEGADDTQAETDGALALDSAEDVMRALLGADYHWGVLYCRTVFEAGQYVTGHFLPITARYTADVSLSTRA